VEEIRLQLVIDPNFPTLVEGAVSFETGASPAQVSDPALFAYEHHGEGFSERSPGALSLLFEDLVAGVPLPLTIAIRDVGGPDTIVALAVFLNREVALHPATPGLVAAADLFHRYGVPMLGHTEPDVGTFLRQLAALPRGLPQVETAQNLLPAIGWVCDFVLKGTLPHPGPPSAEVRVLDVGSNGFVIAESDAPDEGGWVALYRLGFLRGVLVGPDRAGRRQVIVSRKTRHVPLDLGKAQQFLDELEGLLGGVPGWRVEGPFLFSPEGGSIVLVSHLVQVLIRC
jgi:hypothetical protein